MIAVDLESRTQDYLQAFESRDLERCLAFFDDASTLTFHTSVFRGRKEIEDWHRERFDANLRLVRVDRIAVDEGCVVVDAVATSKRLRAWKLNSVNGSMTLRFDGEIVRDVSFALRLGW